MSSIVHFCFGMSADFGGRPFSFCHYLAVRSAWERLQPEFMVLHYVNLPTGPWWELARPMLALHQLPAIEGIYGFPANHPAHRADIVRLVALLVMGGVYLDTDVLVLRSFESLGSPSFAAALEVTGAGELVGLSNAILVAEPDAPFARLCLEGHDPQRSLWHGFRSRGRDYLYVEMSVRYPAMLAGLCPGLVQALPTDTFLSTDWRPESLAALFDGQVQVPEEALALHLWESHAWLLHLSTLTPEWVRSTDSTFARLAWPFLPEAHGRGLPTQPPQLDPSLQHQMAQLFLQVNRVDRVNSAAPHRRVQRRLKAFVTGLRAAWNAPLQERLEQLQTKVALQPVPLPPTAAQPSGHSWARCGALDGSWDLIQPHLPEPQCSAIVVTGPLGEPGACAALARHPVSSCLWVSDSLQRAAQLAVWMQAKGIDGRAVHHPHRHPQLIPQLALQLFTAVPTLLVIGPTPHLQPLLEGLLASAVRPELLLITVPVGSSSLHPALNLRSDGLSAESIDPLLSALGYSNLCSSGDGQFQLLQQQGAFAPKSDAEQPGRLIPGMRLNSLYGDLVML
jgi:hypothetical protein